MRRWGVVWGVGLVVVMAGPAVADAAGDARLVRSGQDASELGLTTELHADTDGAIVLTAHAAGLVVDKRVYADGRFDVRIAAGKSDRVAIAGDADGISVAPARGEAVRLRPDASGYEAEAARVRAWLAASAAIQRFRQLVDVLEERNARGADALSLRTTGALVAELMGDPGAARRFGRSFGQGRAGYRAAQYAGSSCWDTYQRLVVQAANQLESCIQSFAVYNPMRQVCAAVWVLMVESAWFQFLSCSAIPLK